MRLPPVRSFSELPQKGSAGTSLNAPYLSPPRLEKLIMQSPPCGRGMQLRALISAPAGVRGLSAYPRAYARKRAVQA